MRFNYWITAGLACILAVFISGNAIVNAQSNYLMDTSELFAPVLEKFSQVNLPTVLLPKQLPRTTDAPLQAVVESMSPNHYAVGIYAEGCQVTACFVASVTGEKISSQTVPLTQIVEKWQQERQRLTAISPEQISQITLAGDRQAYFLPWVVYSAVTPSRVIVEENGIRYIFAIKGGSQENVTEFANSAF
jgi:hypothetical protein